MKKFQLYLNILLTAILFTNCSNLDRIDNEEESGVQAKVLHSSVTQSSSLLTSNNDFYYGADLSYVNEMEDCGATYSDINGVSKDTYQIFSEAGANLIRIRLWHNPDWTNYSNLADVKIALQRAKNLNIKVLLDFHYSDTWADPGYQQIPAAWLSEINNTTALGDLLYNYTYDTLTELAQENLLPEMVQVGNETNGNILQEGEVIWPIDWPRNSYLFNKGIEAVRTVSQEQSADIEVMLHVADPANAQWWFGQAQSNGITDFDWIGLSYYPTWHNVSMNNLSGTLQTVMNENPGKRLMIVETCHPFTDGWNDSATNIYGNDISQTGHVTSQQGQFDFLEELTQIVAGAGGQGVIYWEPAWVSTGCSTQFGQGSNWENVTLFDFNNQATLGMNFYGLSNTTPPPTPDFVCQDLRALGDAIVSVGWNFPGKRMKCRKNKMKARMSLTQGTFRVFTEPNNWSSGLGYDYFIDQGYTIDNNLVSAQDADNNFSFIGNSGSYVLEINATNKTINLF